MKARSKSSIAPWLAAAALLALPAAADAAEQLDMGAALAANCYLCHGPGGTSQTAIPKISHLSAQAIAENLRGSRDGKKPGTIMPRIAKGYTDAQIDAIVAHFDKMRK